MKLISTDDNLATAAEPEQVAEVIDVVLHDSTEPASVPPADDLAGEVFTASPKLTWSEHMDLFRSASINKGIKDWMAYSMPFRNWVATCLTAFAAMPNVITWAASVPDQFRADVGVSEIHFFNVRPGEVHVMN